LEWGAAFVAVLFLGYERIHRWWLDIREEELRRNKIADIWDKVRGRFAGRSRGIIASWVLFVTAAIGLAMLVWSWADPVWVGRYFRTDTLFFVWAASIIPVLALFAYFTENYRIPVMTLLVVAAVLFSASNDNHVIRFIDGNGANPDERETVRNAAVQWFQQQTAATASTAPSPEKHPLVIVATAGGGSRAAYWTATVLGRLQDCYPEFAKHVFAISGVSGGSLGAAAFRAVLTDLPSSGPVSCRPDKVDEIEDGVATRAQDVVGGDFLAAAVAAMLYPDLVQRFLPRPIESADRARAIELAWEDAYRRIMQIPGTAGTGRFAGSFIRTSVPNPGTTTDSTAKRWPALFLNATWAETGRRLVISPLKLSDPSTDQGIAHPAADDLLALIGRDIALSTAASLSARFPYVLPAGTLKDAEGVVQGHAVDGGYFENYGAVTASEILAEVKGALGDDFHKVRPIVILISSDPTLPNELNALCNLPSANTGRCPVDSIKYAPEIRLPFRTFRKTRETRGIVAALNLGAYVEKNLDGVFAQFRLCQSPANMQEASATPAGRDAPLGWALSESAKQAIKRMLTDLDRPDNPCLRINGESWAALHGLFGSVHLQE
jgi:hypothetical protein